MLRDPDSEPPWVPRADMFMNSAGSLTIKVELAALRREDVELFVEDQKIRITGHRPDVDRDTDGSHYLATGINWGWFDMVLDVPKGFDPSRARAQYQNGLLRVLIPPKK